MKRTLFSLIAIVVVVGCLIGYHLQHAQNSGEANFDLPQMIDSGRITALTLYGSTSYFVYRGEEMGLQYEWVQQLADSLGLRLQIVVARNVEDLITRLRSGEGDLIAYNLPLTRERRKLLRFCGDERISHQVIVQRTNADSRKLLRDVTDLIGRTVHVKPGKYFDRLTNLNEEIGGGIIIQCVTSDSITTEDLISRVASGEIELTVADNELAALNRTWFPNIDYGLVVSFDQKASWAVRKSSVQLAQFINAWSTSHRLSQKYSASMKKYFEFSKQISHPPILSLREGRISHFDEIFKKYAPEIGWDWRLLASLAYTESNFDTLVVSWAGAKGLMQLMPATSRIAGVPEGMEQSPEASVKGSIWVLQELSHSFKSIADSAQRIKFVLAAYNAGAGHIFDAMNLAEKYGKDRSRWDENVEHYILLKSEEKYYTDSVCRNGYFRGSETWNFVHDILARYYSYREKIK